MLIQFEINVNQNNMIFTITFKVASKEPKTNIQIQQTQFPKLKQ